MERSAKRLRNVFLGPAMAAVALAGWAGQAGAAAITVTAPPATGAVQAGASAMAGSDIGLGIQLFVGGILLVTAACFAWLLYLMVTSPPEQEDTAIVPDPAEGAADSPAAATLLQLLPGAAPASAADAGFARSLAQLFRAWLGTRLGHPGPM
jgi:hypothetical protein